MSDTNFERAKFLAKRALAKVDQFDIADTFVGESIKQAEIMSVDAYVKMILNRVSRMTVGDSDD